MTILFWIPAFAGMTIIKYMKIDLHTHSTYSDGTLDPAKLMEKAHSLGITHIALCDHDSTEGLQQARAKALELTLTLVPAVEINTETNNIHVLGYYVDENDINFINALKKNRDSRERRIEVILGKLSELGIQITKEELREGNRETSLGRPHVADALMRKKIVSTRQEAFEKFLTKGRPAYAPHNDTTAIGAIETILACKGIPVLAHPGFSQQEETIQWLTSKGLQGIEVHYPTHSTQQIKKFSELAVKYNLVVTGGSDYHGPGSGHEAMGTISAPENTLDELLKRKQKLFS